jgi:hypothetical protein
MNPIEEIKSKLLKYPELVYEEKDGYICVLPSSEKGFDVWFTEDDREYTVGFSSWHDHFDKDEQEDALNCFAWGLSDSCRLQVSSRKGREYKWTVQSLEEGDWETYSTTALFDFSFWRKKSITYKANNVIVNDYA